MAEIGAFVAKTQLFRLLARVRQGEEFTITYGGTPVAVLGPLPECRDSMQARAILRRLREDARRHSKAPVSTKEIMAWRDEGRR